MNLGNFMELDAIVKYLGAIKGQSSINYSNFRFLILYFFIRVNKHSLVY
jgi:hypothetical protein